MNCEIVKLLSLVWLFNVQPWAHQSKHWAFVIKKTLFEKIKECACSHILALGLGVKN